MTRGGRAVAVAVGLLTAAGLTWLVVVDPEQVALVLIVGPLAGLAVAALTLLERVLRRRRREAGAQALAAAGIGLAAGLAALAVAAQTAFTAAVLFGDGVAGAYAATWATARSGLEEEVALLLGWTVAVAGALAWARLRRETLGRQMVAMFVALSVVGALGVALWTLLGRASPTAGGLTVAAALLLALGAALILPPLLWLLEAGEAQLHGD